jgi:ABC-type cobalamin transport system permease subunit
MIRKPTNQKQYAFNRQMTAKQQYKRENDIVLQRLTLLLVFVILVTLCLGAAWLWLIA